MPAIPLTAGRVTALWLVLRSLDKLGGNAAPAELKGYASRSSLRLGALPISDGVLLALQGRLIQDHLQRYELTGLGCAALALGREDEPSPDVRRFLLSVLLLTDPPAWVAYWQGDPDSLDLVIPEGERRTLIDSGILPNQPVGRDLSSWAFWNALKRVPLASEVSNQRKILGNAGEQLSLKYEQQRLTDEGFPALAERVQWVSRESDAYGFDLLSFAGRQGSSPDEHLAIEVKSSALPRGAYLHFFLTAHEWEMATQLTGRYLVHAWNRVDPGPPPVAREGGPIIVDAGTLVNHLPGPAECSEGCRWQTCQIFLRTDGLLQFPVEPI